MATFYEMQTNIADNLGRADLASEIQTAIRRAIKHYEREQFWFSAAEDSFVATAGTSSYTLSNSYASIEQVMVNYAQYKYPLGRESYETINEIDLGNFQGQPDWYAEQNGVVRLYPVPNATFTVSYVYQAKAATLTNSDSTNVFTLNAEDLIEARACWWLSSFKLHNANASAVWKQIELDALEQLRQESTTKTTTGRIRSTSF